MSASVPSLVTILARIPDPRKAHGRQHPCTALLLLCIAGLLSGANSQRGLARWGQQLPWPWLRALGFTRAGGPSQPTLHRLLRDVDVGQLETRLCAWLAARLFGKFLASWMRNHPAKPGGLGSTR